MLGNTTVTINSGGTLTGIGNNATTGVIAGTVTAAGGGAISLLTPSTAALRVTGGITLGDPSNAYGTANSYSTLNFYVGAGNTAEQLTTPGVITLNTGGAYIDVTDPSQQGTFTLATFGSLAGSGTSGFSLSPTTAGVDSQSVGRDLETLAFSGTTITLTISGPTLPGVAFFDGAVSTVWNDNSNVTYLNWSLDKAGTTDAGNIPGATTDVILTGSGAPAGSPAAVNLSGSLTTTLGASTTINSLNINSVAASNTIAADGSTLTINGTADSNTDLNGAYTGNAAGTGIRVLSGAGAVSIAVPVVLGGTNSQTWYNNSSNLLTVSGAVTGAAVAGTQTLTLSGTGSGGITVSGAISNDSNGGLTALAINNTGGGVTTLSGASSYTGGTTINAGNVILGNATALGLASSAPLAFGPGDTSTLELNGNSVAITDLTTNATPGAPVIENGASGSGTSTLTVNTAHTDTYTGTLTNGGSAALALTKSGTGSLTLTAANNYTGNTTVTAGTLDITGTLAGSSIANSGTFIEASGAAITGAGSTFANTAGASTLSGVNTFSGATTLSGGSLTLGNALALQDSALTYNSPASLSFGTLASVTLGGLNGAGNLPTGDTALTSLTLNLQAGGNNSFSGAIANSGTTPLALTISGNAGASQTLSGTDTFSGPTVINAGTLTLGGPLALQDSALNYNNQGGVLSFGSLTAATLGGLSGAENIPLAGSSLTSLTFNLQAGGSNTYTGVIVDNGASPLSVNVTGTATGLEILTGSDSYTGLTTVTNGTLVAANDFALGSGTAPTSGLLLNPASGSAIVDFTSTAPSVASLSSSGAGTSGIVLGNAASGGSPTTLTVGANGLVTTFGGTISDLSGTAAGAIGNLTVDGGSTLILTNSNTFTGTTIISGAGSKIQLGNALAPRGQHAQLQQPGRHPQLWGADGGDPGRAVRGAEPRAHQYLGRGSGADRWQQ